MDEEPDVPLRPRRTGLWIAIAVLAAAVALAPLVLRPGADPADCGTVGPATDTAALPADARCTLTGRVEGTLVLSMGQMHKSDIPTEKYKGVRFFAKLEGANVFAILPGERSEVAERYARDEHLQGLAIEGRGHLFDPDPLPGYRGTAVGLRKLYGLPEGAPVRLFDTDPTDR